MAHVKDPMVVTLCSEQVAHSKGADCAIWGPDGDLVALVWGDVGLDIDADDTAALFAAGPELLNDLKLASRSVRILSEMLQGQRRKDNREIEAATDRSTSYERTIEKAAPRKPSQ